MLTRRFVRRRNGADFLLLSVACRRLDVAGRANAAAQRRMEKRRDADGSIMTHRRGVGELGGRSKLITMHRYI